jgi:branched-chain amino acid transport system substrate-binding protein
MASLLLGCCQQSPPAPTIAASVTIPGSSASPRAIGTIGHAGPTSGPIPHVEKDNENDARLAVEVLNGIGGNIWRDAGVA